MLRPLRSVDEFAPFIDAFILGASGVVSMHSADKNQIFSGSQFILDFVSRVDDDIHMDRNHVLKLLTEDYIATGDTPHTTDYLRVACQMLTISTRAWLESIDKFREIRHQPEVEFFRHIRNASAHGNTFRFKKYKDGQEEPVRSAVWRKIEITKKMEGTRLFFEFLSAGDLIYLLDDIGSLL